MHGRCSSSFGGSGVAVLGFGMDPGVTEHLLAVPVFVLGLKGPHPPGTAPEVRREGWGSPFRDAAEGSAWHARKKSGSEGDAWSEGDGWCGGPACVAVWLPGCLLLESCGAFGMVWAPKDGQGSWAGEVLAVSLAGDVSGGSVCRAGAVALRRDCTGVAGSRARFGM